MATFSNYGKDWSTCNVADIFSKPDPIQVVDPFPQPYIPNGPWHDWKKNYPSQETVNNVQSSVDQILNKHYPEPVSFIQPHTFTQWNPNPITVPTHPLINPIPQNWPVSSYINVPPAQLQLPILHWSDPSKMDEILHRYNMCSVTREIFMRKELESQLPTSSSFLEACQQKELFYKYNPEARIGDLLGIKPEMRFGKPLMTDTLPNEFFKDIHQKVDFLCDRVTKHQDFWKSSFEKALPLAAPHFNPQNPLNRPLESLHHLPSVPESYTDHERATLMSNFVSYLYQQDKTFEQVKEKFDPIFGVSSKKDPITPVPVAMSETQYQSNFSRGIQDFKHFEEFFQNQKKYPEGAPERFSTEYLKQNIVGPEKGVGGHLAYFGGNLVGKISQLGPKAKDIAEKFMGHLEQMGQANYPALDLDDVYTAAQISQLADEKSLEMQSAIRKGADVSTVVEDAFKAIYGAGLSYEPHRTFFQWEQGLHGKTGFSTSHIPPSFCEGMLQYAKQNNLQGFDTRLSHMTPGYIEGLSHRLFNEHGPALAKNPPLTDSQSKLKPFLHLDEFLLDAKLEIGPLVGNYAKEQPNYKPSQIVTFGTEVIPHGKSVWMNGMLNDFQTASSRAINISGMMGGKQVDLIYSPTLGFQRDMIKLEYIKNGYLIAEAKMCKDYILNYFENNSGVLHINVHSRGGAVLNSILPEIPEAYRDRMYIDTYGTAAFIDAEMAFRVRNIWHPNDQISRGADPKGWLRAKQDGSLVQLENDGKTLFVAHSLEGGYKEPLKQNCEAFAEGQF